MKKHKSSQKHTLPKREKPIHICQICKKKGGWKTEVFWTKKPTTQEPDVVSSPNFAWWEAF